MKKLRGTTETSSGAMLLYGKRARIVEVSGAMYRCFDRNSCGTSWEIGGGGSGGASRCSRCTVDVTVGIPQLARINVGDLDAARPLTGPIRHDGSVRVATHDRTVRVNAKHDTGVLGGGGGRFVIAADDAPDDRIVGEDSVHDDTSRSRLGGRCCCCCC